MAHRPAQRKRQRKRQAKLNRKLRAEQRRRGLTATPSHSCWFLLQLKSCLLMLADCWFLLQLKSCLLMLADCWFLLQLKSCLLMLAGWVWRSKYEVQSGKRHGPPPRGRRHRKLRAVQTVSARVSARPMMGSSLFPLLICLLVLAGCVPPKWLPKFMAWFPPWISFTFSIAVLVPMFLNILSGWPMEQAWVMLIAIWPQWALTLLLSEEKSLEEYVRANAVTEEHRLSARNEERDAILCTEVGMNLWSGFIEVIIKAYRCNRSWRGEFSSKDLRMSGHCCRISSDPIFPASFPNLLLDFAKLAELLINHFRVERNHEAHIRYLYRSMIKPGASKMSTPDAQEDHIKFIRNHPALRSLRQKRLFLEDVMKAFRSMEPAEKKRFAKTLKKIKVASDWRLIAQRNASFCRVLFYRNMDRLFVYENSSEELFRFFRNYYAHGSDADRQLREVIGNLEDIDCIDMELMPRFVIQLVHQMIVNSNTSGKFAYAWKHYGLIG